MTEPTIQTPDPKPTPRGGRPPRPDVSTCRSAVLIKGEHFQCESEPGHYPSWPHANGAAEAVWGDMAAAGPTPTEETVPRLVLALPPESVAQLPDMTPAEATGFAISFALNTLAAERDRARDLAARLEAELHIATGMVRGLHRLVDARGVSFAGDETFVRAAGQWLDDYDGAPTSPEETDDRIEGREGSPPSP